MSTTKAEKSQDATGDEYFQRLMQSILTKLKNDPSSITTEDARRLSENAVAGDLRTAKIISAVEAFAAASETINEVDPQLGQAPHTSLLTVINDLKVAVEQNPTDVTTEVLRKAQTVVSKMQKVVGHSNAPHPELEAVLQEEIAKIEPKVVEGTVTIDEANHLHSLKARAHGHTEKGGITSIAQSVAAKRERQLSLSSGSIPTENRSHAYSKTLTPHEQSRCDKMSNLRQATAAIRPKIEQGTVTEAEANLLHSRETRAHGQTDKNVLTASAQSLAAHKRQASLSDQTNTSPSSQHDHNVNVKLAGMTLEPKSMNESENVMQGGAAYIQPREQHAHDHVDKGGITPAAQAMSAAHKRQGSQTVEVK